MPANMFEDSVSPRAALNSNRYALPLSFAIHTTVLAIVIVVPLVATDVLPSPRQVLHYTMPEAIPVVAPPPVQMPRVNTPPVVQAAIVAPVIAPANIGVESGVIVDQSTIQEKGLESIVGVGVPAVAVDVAPAPPPAPVAPVRPGGDIKPPVRVKYVAPAYPEMARLSRIQGVVIIEAVIGVSGKVDNMRVLRSHTLLEAAAVAAVRDWEYTPTLLNGNPTPVIMTVTVQFRLD